MVEPISTWLNVEHDVPNLAYVLTDNVLPINFESLMLNLPVSTFGFKPPWTLKPLPILW
jgi:hypothetical protein